MSYIDELINSYNLEDYEDDDKFNVEQLLKVLENDKHEDIINLTKSKIKKMKNKILQQLGLPVDIIKELHSKLQEYRYVNDLVNLKEGSYIRWIQLKNIQKTGDIKLTNGGFVIGIKIFDTGLQILCKNVFDRKFQIIFDDVIIFQKITQQEKLLIDIVDYLHK